MKARTTLDIASKDIVFEIFDSETQDYIHVTDDTDQDAIAKRLKVHPDLIETLRSMFVTVNESIVEDLTDLWNRQSELEKRIALLEKHAHYHGKPQ